MASFTLRNDQIVPAYNNLSVLISWLRPGLLAYRLGLLKTALEPATKTISTAHAALVEEYVQYETVTDEKGKETRKRKFVLTPQGPGFDMGDNVAEFEAKYLELMSGKTEIQFSMPLITQEDIKRIEEKDRVNKDDLPAVDFGALQPLIV